MSSDGKPIISSYVYIPRNEELASGRCRFRYRPSDDSYFVGLTDPKKAKPWIRGWKSLLYSHENVKRTVEKKTNEVYLERENSNLNSRLSWCIDLTTTGLVIDHLNLKLNYIEAGEGQVIVSLYGDDGDGIKKTASYFYDGDFTLIENLCDSRILTVNVHMIGENENDMTRLLNQSLITEHHETPLEIHLRLKRPSFTIDRSLLYVGLMYSHKERSEYTIRTNEKLLRRRNCKYLYLHIHSAKRLPCRSNGNYADPKVKCLLHCNSLRQKSKTKALPKTINPIWNEFLCIPSEENIIQHGLLELIISHGKGLLHSKEVLGSAYLQFVSYHQRSLSKHSFKFPRNINEQQSRRTNLLKNTSVSTMTLDNITDYESENDNSDTISHDNSISRTQINGHFIQETLQYHEEDVLPSVSSGTNSIRSCPTSNTARNNSFQMKPGQPESLSTSSYFQENQKLKKKKLLRKNLYRSGSISNMLEDDNFHVQTSRLAHEHWSIVFNNPDQWFYCWHPLVGVENML